MSMQLNLKKILGELQDLFYIYKPDEEDFLNDYPEISEEIEVLINLQPENDIEYIKAIKQFIDFLEEWFPNEIDESEMNDIQNKIQKAKIVYEI
ncbi:hypothetical protein AAGG74_14450 [Bacillus mexicanus]|uniref:hypothetical protein n=1 Tax=Bacillus mexicanus TaxID=2834415 RepID=UPI003D19004F